MAVGWESLPLLPLSQILEYLDLEDSLAAMSVCKSWRNALTSVFDGEKDHIEIRSSEPERNLFLARVFKKRVTELTVCIEGWTTDELEHLFYCVLPEFFHSVELKELTFIGPSYLQQNQSLPAIKLKRVIVESLLVKHARCILKLAYLGCEIDVANYNDRYMHEQIRYHSAPLRFRTSASLPNGAGAGGGAGAGAGIDRIMSRPNLRLMDHSTLRQVTLDIDMLSHSAAQWLPQLPCLAAVGVCVRGSSPLEQGPLLLAALVGASAGATSPRPIRVALYIIELPEERFEEVMKNVLVEGLELVSLKVLFCKTFYAPLLSHVVRYYKTTLRELVWVDGPSDVIRSSHRFIKAPGSADIENARDARNINPLVLLCWQCVHLKKLVIHGYWIWQYDLMGCVRLRKTLRHLEVSALHHHQNRFTDHDDPCVAIRVFPTDPPSLVTKEYTRQINMYSVSLLAWRPRLWPALPRALCARPQRTDVANYVRDQILMTEFDYMM